MEPALAVEWGWWVGWTVGAVVVLLAAGLLVTIITVGRRIVGQAEAIKLALDGTRTNTDPLWDVRATNHEIDRITRGLTRAREGLGS